MSEFYYLKSYEQKGKMGISRKAFETIAMIASGKLNDVTVKGFSSDDDVIARFSSLFSLPPRPCHAYFKNNGRVDLEINVAVGSGVLNITNLCTNIQQEVAANVNMMCETVPVQVEIHVSKEKPKNPVKPVEVKTQKPKKQ